VGVRNARIVGVGGRAHGDADADAVSFGDYHVPRRIGLSLTGAPVDDAGLGVPLEPFRRHRYRAQRLVELCGALPARRGPTTPPCHHLPARYR